MTVGSLTLAEDPEVALLEGGRTRRIRFRSETDPAPGAIVVATDRTTAGDAIRLLRGGSSLLYRGTEGGARQLLQAIARRSARRRTSRDAELPELFHRERASRSAEHRLLAGLLVELDAGWRLHLDRGRDIAAACDAAWGPSDGEARLTPLRELIGVIGAYEWQRRGVSVPGLGAPVHPRYGVFAPTRTAYVELLREAPDPRGASAIDVGTGTGVLALLLAARGAREVVATDVDPRAVACARANVELHRCAGVVRVELADLYPATPARADVVVCNPPWLPGKPRKPIERAIFDADSRMLEGFLAGLGTHLGERGEGWLLISDLAERLRLRDDGHVEARIRAHGLAVAWTRSRASAAGTDDADGREPEPIRAARAGETLVLRGLVRA